LALELAPLLALLALARKAWRQTVPETIAAITP
jgi:hypothetical protein